MIWRSHHGTLCFLWAGLVIALYIRKIIIISCVLLVGQTHINRCVSVLLIILCASLGWFLPRTSIPVLVFQFSIIPVLVFGTTQASVMLSVFLGTSKANLIVCNSCLLSVAWQNASSTRRPFSGCWNTYLFPTCNCFLGASHASLWAYRATLYQGATLCSLLCHCLPSAWSVSKNHNCP